MSSASFDAQITSAPDPCQPLSPIIEQGLLDFRSRLRQRKLLKLLLVCACVLFTGYLIQFGSDRLVDTPKLVRAAILFTVLGLTICAVWQMGQRWFWNTRRLTQVARLLRRQFPRLSDQVLSVVELASARGEQRRSPQLVAAAMAQVEKRVQATNLSEALPHGPRALLSIATIVQLVIVIAIFVAVPGAAANALTRLLNPVTSIERFTFTRIEPLPEQWVVASGEPFTVRLVLHADSDWRPRQATCRLMGRSYVAELSSADRAYQFQLPALLETTQATFSIGDYQASMPVAPLNRPELSELDATIELPAYLRYSAPLRSDARAGALVALSGSQIQLSGQANRELSQMSLNGRSVPVQGSRFESDRWTATQSEQWQLQWRDQYGLTGSSGREIKLRLVQDKLPQVSCQGLSQISVWLASDTLKFEIAAEDDFGLAKVGVQWRAVDSSELSSTTQTEGGTIGQRDLAMGTPEQKRLSAQATFSCETEKVKPQILELRGFAEDYRGAEGRTYGVPYVIRFMSASEHADWIAGQLRRWKGKLDGIHDSEMQQLDENRELRQDLAGRGAANSSTSQQLSQQALDERSNSDKLQKAIDEGRALLEQALRNEELRSQQIESWADALERLNKIARDSMPEVANKLERAASAAGELDSPTNKGSDNPAAPTAPGLSKPEKSMDKEDLAANPAASGGSPSSLPEALLGPGQSGESQTGESKPGTPEGEDKKPSGNEPAQQLLEQSIEDQTRLIEEFRRAKESFGELLSELENSTFVKRLKAAAELERELAGRVNSLVGATFGRSSESLQANEGEAVNLLNSPLEQAAENMERIQRDLEAYQRDNPAAAREEVLGEMKALDTLTKLKEMPLRMARNLRGDTLHRLDYWADTLDRWAEELAGPGKAGGAGEDEQPRDRLPAAILLEILRIIYDQIDVRDETRTLAQVQPVDDAARQDVEERAAAQAVQQMSIQQRTLNTISDIRAIPGGIEKFKDELQKLNKAVQHMDDASAMLVDGQVTDAILAAQTAAIEALIESRRGGGGSGSGGGDSGSGSLAGGSTDRVPLDLVGPASDQGAKIQPRQAGEGTGKTGRVLPDEYREGLDAFLNKLNQNRGSQ